MMKSTLLQEYIAQQPALWRALLDSREEITAEFSRRFGGFQPDRVILVGSGSSHYAALMARPVLEHAWGTEVTCLVPSEAADARLTAAHPLYFAISQSGVSTNTYDLVCQLTNAGRAVIAVTEQANSPVGLAASLSVPLRIGTERIGAKTKGRHRHCADINAVSVVCLPRHVLWAENASGLGSTVPERSGKPVPFPCVEPRASERVPAVPSPVCARLRQQSRSRAGRSAEAAGDQLSSSFLLSFGRVYPWYPKRPGRRCLPFVPAAVPRARSGPDAAPSEFLQISWGLLRLDLPQRHRPAGRSSPAGCRRRCPPVLRVSSCFCRRWPRSFPLPEGSIPPIGATRISSLSWAARWREIYASQSSKPALFPAPGYYDADRLHYSGLHISHSGLLWILQATDWPSNDTGCPSSHVSPPPMGGFSMTGSPVPSR